MLTKLTLYNIAILTIGLSGNSIITTTKLHMFLPWNNSCC